jgi:hypothetical protein
MIAPGVIMQQIEVYFIMEMKPAIPKPASCEVCRLPGFLTVDRK